MKSVAISALTLFAGFVFAGVPPLCLVEDFIGKSGRAPRSFLVGGANVVATGMLEGDPGSATNGVPVSGITGTGCHQRTAKSPNTSNSPAAIAPIKYRRRYRSADTGRAGD